MHYYGNETNYIKVIDHRLSIFICEESQVDSVIFDSSMLCQIQMVVVMVAEMITMIQNFFMAGKAKTSKERMPKHKKTYQPFRDRPKTTVHWSGSTFKMWHCNLISKGLNCVS